MCDIVPQGGNSHSSCLNATVAQAVANSLNYMSSNAPKGQYSRVSARVSEANSHLYPLDERIGSGRPWPVRRRVARPIGDAHPGAVNG